MSDKAPAIAPVVPTFVAGEAPTAAKLNALSAVIRRISQVVEYYIGDVWGESWPYDTWTSRLTQEFGKKVSDGNTVTGGVDRFLDIVNVARLIGPASNLNPFFLDEAVIEEDIPESTTDDIHEFNLKYVPMNPETGVTFDPGLVFVTWQDSHALVQADGDYHITATGTVYSHLPMDGGKVYYSTAPYTYGGGSNYSGASFNCIPDPSQCENGDGLAITGPDGDGAWTLTIPEATHHITSEDGENAALNASDATFEFALTLPKVLLDNLSVGDQIPTGFLYVRNWTTGEIYDQADYFLSGDSSVLMSGPDLSDAVGNGDQLYIITVGTDITTSIADLRRKTRHTHDRTYGEEAVSVYSLSNRFKFPGLSGLVVESEILNNYFPQYLHRDGWDGTTDAGMNDENVMRGHLALGAVQAGGVDRFTEAGQATTQNTEASAKVLFLGNATYQPFVRGVEGALQLHGDGAATDGNVSGTEVAGLGHVRVEQGHLIPDMGICSALTQLEWAIKPVAFQITGNDVTIESIDLAADYGLTVADYRIFNYDAIVMLDSSNAWTKQHIEAADSLAFTAVLHEDTHELELAIIGTDFIGADWTARIVLWAARI